MNQKRILFNGFEKTNVEMGFGDIFECSMACYLKGKSLGYEDIRIVFPIMGNNGKSYLTDKSFYYQSSDFLPWTWYPRNKQIDSSEWDKVFDITQLDSFYDGYQGFLKGILLPLYQYPDISYLETNTTPYLYLKRSYNGKPYILFQYASTSQTSIDSKYRHTNNKHFVTSFEIIKDLFGSKYEYWKIGDASSIDNRFDRIVPLMYDDIDGFFKIVYNSSLMISSHSAPAVFTYFVPHLPVIMTSIYRDAYTRVPEYWQKRHPRFKVDSRVPRHPMWGDEDVLIFFKGMDIDKNKIKEFLEKHKLL